MTHYSGKVKKTVFWGRFGPVFKNEFSKRNYAKLLKPHFESLSMQKTKQTQVSTSIYNQCGHTESQNS